MDSSDNHPLSPYIADSLRKKALERAQLKALTDAGIRPNPWTTLEEMIAKERALRKSRAKSQRRDAQRRARLANAEIEKFTRDEIIRRDGTTCYLCRLTVNPEEIHLDHVIPLSRGGGHTRANIRVSCPRCNLAKGRMTETEYRAMISPTVSHARRPSSR